MYLLVKFSVDKLNFTREQKMKRILVVDDEEKIRAMYTKLLRSEGFPVLEAHDAIEAHEILKREHIDLILLDIKMARINGNVLYEIIQFFHKKSQVIVTSFHQVEEQQRIIQGAADYHDKSQGVDLLISKVKKALVIAEG